MNARDVEQAGDEVARIGRAVVGSLVVGVALAVIAGIAAPVSGNVAIALSAGAALDLVRGVVRWLDRRELIERLALDPSAYAIPQVARFGSRAAALGERRRLASWISSVAHEQDRPLDMHLVVRAGHCAQLLETLAHELASPSAHVDPATAVACRRLLTRPVQSPLYNPNLPEEDLTALLLRLCAGISLADRSAALAARPEVGA